MICQKCKREATYDMEFGSITYYLCEHCNHKFGYIDSGQASEHEMDIFRRNYQEQVEHNIKTSAKVQVKTKAKHIKMYDPRQMTSAGYLRARG